MRWNNDSTYQGVAKNEDFYFNSPLVESEEIVHFSDELKTPMAEHIKLCNYRYKLDLIKRNYLNSYDNSDFLWLSYELNNLRELYNNAMHDPITGKLLPERREIPYIQLVLTENAFSVNERYPKSYILDSKRKDAGRYAVSFEHSFLKAYMNFLFQIFDDNPQIVDENKNVVHQYKAPLYRMPSFDKFFGTRHDLPGIIFEQSVDMLLAHELAHIGNGHLDLQLSEPEYGNLADTVIVEEDDADAQAICWVLGKRFLEVPGNRLDITFDDFINEMSLAIFSVYMLYTWDYSKENRIWSENTMKEYLKNKPKHLPYQLRAYNMLCVANSRLRQLGEWCKRGNYKTADGKTIDKDLMDKISKEACEMIQSFEYAYHMFFATTEQVYEKALDGQFNELREMALKEFSPEELHLKKTNIPFLLGFEPDAQAEIKRIKDMWPGVKEKLIKNGTYCKLR